MGEGQGRIDVPTLHVQGDCDFCLQRARKLVREHCHSDRTQLLTVDAAHQLPTQPADVARVIEHIRALAAQTVGVKGKPLPCRSSRRPLAAPNALVPLVTQTPVLATR